MNFQACEVEVEAEYRSEKDKNLSSVFVPAIKEKKNDVINLS
jgi:hypothetical protein